jgi:hypothetical protein
MSTNQPFLVGIKGQNGSIHLIPTKPPTFWQRLGKWLAWVIGWGLWTLIVFWVGYMAGAL